MINYCDACKKSFKGKPKTISAKEWNKDICISSYEKEFGGCDIVNCKYNIEGEICIEFDFCSKCSKSRSVLNKKFENVKPFNW